MITKHIPFFREFQNWLQNSGNDSLTMVLLITGFLLILAAIKLPPNAKGIILGWVLFP